MLGLAFGIRGCLPNPNASVAATSRRAPSFAPSGANTELHECANELTSEPPQASPPALRSATPSSVAAVWTGYIVDGRTIRLSSAAAAVMILNTEPGGCGADTASPASAFTAPSRGRITAMPPSRSPSAAEAARLSPGSIVVFTGRPRTARVRATTRSPNSSRAGAWPVSRSAYIFSSPSLSALGCRGAPPTASTDARSGGRPERRTTASSRRSPGSRSE